MRTQGKSSKPKSNKHPSLIRIVLLIGGLLLLTTGATIWLLSNAQKINSGWFNILAIIFGVLGVLLTFIFWLFPFPTNRFETNPTEPVNTSLNVQQLSSQQVQQAQQFQHVQNLQQFFFPSNLPGSQQSTSIENISRSDAAESDPIQIRNKRTQKNEVITNLGLSINAKKLMENYEEELPPDPDVIFQINVPLSNLIEFYGRDNIRATLISRTRKRASTSIVGPRRIGKTWLMSYFRLVAPQQLGSNFQVGYLDATSPSCTTVSGFTSRAVRELGNVIVQDASVGLDTLEQMVNGLSSKNIISVLCIDEFEGLCNPQFDISFFTGLRAIEQNGLVLIVVSKQPISTLVSEQVKSSPFFNIFEPLILQPFTVEEAKAFIKDKGNQTGFTEQEQSYVLEYGRKDDQLWIPLRLQLAGKMLLEDKNGSVRDKLNYYRPKDLDYWRQFEKRLEEKYQGAVGI